LTVAAALVCLAGALPAWTVPFDRPISVGTGALLLFSVGYVAVGETRRGLSVDRRGLPSRTDGRDFLAVAAAAPVTRLLAVEANLGVVVASALVGLCAFLVVPEDAVAAYCGSFVGMASPAVLPALVTVTAAGVVAGIVFIAAKRVFDGFGGKLGTTAFVGCGAVVLATGLDPEIARAPDLGTAALLVVAGAIAAVVTFVLSVDLDHGPVVGSAVVGLVAGLVCPAVIPAGGQVAAVAFCGSFAGMASPDRISGPAAMLVAGTVSGALFVGATPFFVGLGGKLGTIAFAGCLFTCGLQSAGDDLPVSISRSG
jgi:hypothetical protein